ncbi:MAG TPA: Rieske (2Fe-2S) protein [Pseudonocardiaceae bacterium]|nr:Rieske (2Fe-2S) protein [Pseudonocardiaceae bacterium]
MTIARDAEYTQVDDVETTDGQDGNVSRRQLIRTAAVAGTVVVAGVGLAACSSNSNTGSGSTGGSPATTGGGAPATTGGGGGASGGTALAKTSDIPVGGGMIFTDHSVVVTQPAAGTFKGFGTTCTHLGCTVDKVANGLIECPCHGSRYSVVDGTVKAGPAPRPLPSKNVSVSGGEVMLDS